jgi:hypothetical protein
MTRAPVPGSRGASARYESGPDATTRATAAALARVGGAASLVLVEGVSDQIAVETAAAGTGRDLRAEGVVVVPIGGAHAAARVLAGLHTKHSDVPIAALCDAREAEVLRRGAIDTGVDLRLFVCVEDLEDELIRAVGASEAERVLEAEGDLARFRTLQAQPAWRGHPLEAQLRRFLGSGARRKLRYAEALTATAVANGCLPAPLAALLAVTH